MYKEQSAAIKVNYPIIFRVSGLVGLLLTILSFLTFPRFVNKMVLDEEVQIVIEQIDIPQTEQFDRPPPPARPSVPVESESEDVADDVTLDEFNLDDFDAWDAPPPPPEYAPGAFPPGYAKTLFPVGVTEDCISIPPGCVSELGAPGLPPLPGLFPPPEPPLGPPATVP